MVDELNALLERARSSRRRTVAVEVGTLARVLAVVEALQADHGDNCPPGLCAACDALKEIEG